MARRSVESIKRLIARVQAKGKTEFDIYDLMAAQSEERERYSTSGHYNFNAKEFAGILAHHHIDLGIEKVEEKTLRTGVGTPVSASRQVHLWRVKDTMLEHYPYLVRNARVAVRQYRRRR